MLKPQNNFAFIDGNNLYLGTKSEGWRIDYQKLRVLLWDKFAVTRAYLFLGYVKKYEEMYTRLRECGFALIFKPIVRDHVGNVKGNVDAEIVLQAMIDFDSYRQAVLLTNDGDFYCLVSYLRRNDKLYRVMSPHRDHCSKLLKKAAKDKLEYLHDYRARLTF